MRRGLEHCPWHAAPVLNSLGVLLFLFVASAYGDIRPVPLDQKRGFGEVLGVSQ
jgi:hypothetical protein